MPGLVAPHSVGSFFVSRVDTEVDKRLEAIGIRRGARAARQGRRRAGAGRLRQLPPLRRGRRTRCRVQRPLWASTSTKNPDYPELLYVDTLIGPDTVNTLPEPTLEAFDAQGDLARTVDCRRRGRPGNSGGGRRRLASTWTTSPTCLNAKVWPAFADAHEKLLGDARHPSSRPRVSPRARTRRGWGSTN